MKRTILTIVSILFVITVFALGVSAVLASKPSEAERFEVFVNNESLIKKLGLAGEQIEKLKTAIGNSYFPHGRDGKPAGDPPAEEGFRMDDEFRAEIYKILTPEQKKQVLTYKFQLDGGLDANSLYATKLEVFDLSKEQTRKLRDIEVERSGKYQELLKGIDFKKLSEEESKTAIEKNRSAMKTIATEYNAKMKAVLTPEQLEIAKKLTEEGKGLREEVGLKPLK
ncbi:MAG: hypothetical protein LBP87_10125 [Planctomycetaceae bacterium]|jgi:Spy/CpxP family protein refolding chaperone|nr:hypothetical protein [Planctomycetaceae bacterium]